MLEALEEVFLQNRLTSANNQEKKIKTILCEDSRTAYESPVLESRINANDPLHPLLHSIEVVNSALSAVSQDVFPHKALAMLKLWMKQHMEKPGNMGICKFMAAVTLMNSKLICFVGATEADLFSAYELLEILEFSLPATWRGNFVLVGYIPTEHNKSRLISKGKQIERAEALASKPSAKPNPKVHSAALGNVNSSKNDKWVCKGKPNGSTAPSTAHEQVQSDGNSNCISNRKMKKHFLAMSRSKNTANTFDQFSTLVECEHKRVKRMTSVKKKHNAEDQDASSSDNSDRVSIHYISPTKVNWSFVQKPNHIIPSHMFRSH